MDAYNNDAYQALPLVFYTATANSINAGVFFYFTENKALNGPIQNCLIYFFSIVVLLFHFTDFRLKFENSVHFVSRQRLFGVNEQKLIKELLIISDETLIQVVHVFVNIFIPFGFS